jgi:release factor glutamine methyltransferase
VTIQQALLKAIIKLRNKKSASAHLDAEVLLAAVLNKPKGYLIAYSDKSLSSSQLVKFNSLISRRLNGLPVAYLTGHKEFYGLDFYINKNVLVPRPETETLAECAIKYAREKISQNEKNKLIIAEIGTGSGCLAITLAKYLPQTRLIATDISPAALSVARKNAGLHHVQGKIKFVKADLLSAFFIGKKIKLPRPDIIVANLPYGTRKEWQNVHHEPQIAVNGGKLGLEKIDQLISQSPRALGLNGLILLEISPTQTEALRYLVLQHWPDKNLIIVKDLAGRDRVAIIK